MSNIELNTQMKTLKLGKKITSYSGVVINAGKGADGKDRVYSAGNQTGYVLELDNPYGSQAMANSILASVKARGVPYQPFKSDSTLIDPAAEIGDGVTVNGKKATIWSIKTRHSPLLAADVAAPMDEEINHEYRYTPRQTREFKRESAYTRSRLTINQDEIRAEVVRATGAESSISGSLSVQADRITAEVTRATNAENRLSASITVQADRITSEVTRATGAESGLGTRIDQRLDNITLSVTSASGASTFTIKDGSTTLDTQSLDLSVKAVNISGKLTIGQLDSTAQGQLVVSSESKTQYYLSTSYSSATGGSWQDTIPTWESGKYYWTRQSTTVTFADNTTETKNSTAVYDKNMTRTESTAISRERTIYKSVAGASGTPDPPTAWVDDVTGNQNTWTCVRPEYNTNFPALYTASQRKTVGGAFTCSAVKLDATTTVIDGNHITTGTIDAARINVNGDLSAFGASVGGWTISSTRLEKEISSQLARVRLSAPTNPSTSTVAISVGTRATTSDSYSAAFSVTYGGKLTAKDVDLSGKITATSGVIGGITLSNGKLTVDTDHVDTTIYDGVNGGLLFGGACVPGSTDTSTQQIGAKKFVTTGTTSDTFFSLNGGLKLTNGGANIGGNVSIGGTLSVTGTISGSFSGAVTTTNLTFNSYGVTWFKAKVKNDSGTELTKYILVRSS